MKKKDYSNMTREELEKELEETEKAFYKTIIGTGLITIGGLLAILGSLKLAAKWKGKYMEWVSIPEKFPLSHPEIVDRGPNVDDPNIRYALQLFYVNHDESDGKFVGEWATGSLDEMREFGEWISKAATEWKKGVGDESK